MPKGSGKMWLPRGMESDKFVTNHRNMLIHMLGKTERELEECIKSGVGDPKLRECQENLARQYEKLYFMDSLNILILEVEGHW